jgi:hypothetical protein
MAHHVQDQADMDEAYAREPADEAVVAFAQALARLGVDLIPVTRVDNQGEPCEHCQLLGRDIAATLYGIQDGQEDSADCCIPCLPVVASEFDQNQSIRVEVAA